MLYNAINGSLKVNYFGRRWEMRKLLSVIIVTVVLISTLWVSVGRAQASGLVTYRGGLFVWGKGVVFVFEGTDFRNKDVKGTSIFAGSSMHALSCSVNKDEGRIVCVAGGGLTEFAGETAVIHLAGQVFYVTMPGKPSQVAGAGAGGCEGVLGADVTFEDIDGLFSTEFVEGDTIEEVQAAADQALASDPDLVDYQLGNLYCVADVGPEEE
jgi:hypothetical protein